MTLQAESAVASLALLKAPAVPSPAVVPMYTPLWYATRVLRTTASYWWEGGVPPSRGRRQRATQAVASMAAHFARRLHAARPAKADAQAQPPTVLAVAGGEDA